MSADALDTNNNNDYAQDFFTRDVYNYSTVSPHVADMFRYGEFQTSLFTGRMQQTIPIYTVEDPDFKMNIALHYNAEGFKPRKHSGYVGYNWFLEAGGYITREVNGYPDEIIGKSDHYENFTNGVMYPQAYPGVEGMYHFITQNPSAGNLNKDDVFELPLAPNTQACDWLGLGDYWHNVGNECDPMVDYMPDIFHFDFWGHKGSFMINNAGEVKIISGDFVDVNLSGILADWSPRQPVKTPLFAFPLYPNENSTITISTTDGYTYIFGGNISKLEYAVNVHNMGQFLPQLNFYSGLRLNPPTITTWYLAEVIAPNKRRVTYFYKPAEKSFWSEILDDIPEYIPTEDDPLWEFNEYVNRFDPYYRASNGLYTQIKGAILGNLFLSQQEYMDYCCLQDLTVVPYTPNSNSYYLHSATKTCILDSIHISGEQPLRIVFDNSQEKTAMYDSVFYGNNSKKNYQLDSIRIISSDSTIKKTTLSYTYSGYNGGSTSFNWRFLNTVTISGIGAYQMDYYNGTYPNLSIKSPTYNFTTRESGETDDYGYYIGSYYSLSLLHKISYPTGGYQTYSYEPYGYDKKRKYTLVDDSIVEINTINETGSKRGVRIKTIHTYDKINHLVETTSYTYSNGIFNDNKYVYGFADNMYPNYGWPFRFRANYDLSAHIGYSQVSEEVTNDRGGTYRIIYRFDTGEDFYSSLHDSDLLGAYEFDDYKFGVLSGAISYRSKLEKWGKLLSKKYYDSNNQLVRSEQFAYNDSHISPNPLPPSVAPQLECTDTIVIFTTSVGAEISKKLYIYPDVLTQKITKDFNQGDSLTTTKTYSYDRKLRLTQETIDDSQGICHFTKYSYPDEVPGAHHSIPSPLFFLIHSNRIGTPVESYSGYIDEVGVKYITSGTINLYGVNTYTQGSNLFFVPYLNQTLSLSLSTPIPQTDYQPLRMRDATLRYDPHYTLTSEYQFDLMNRLTSVKPFGKIETKYTWNGIYPATKTIGNQTWTYTYKPHVGLETVTDPRGIITYYNYDSAGRLIEEYQLVNGQKRVINVYQYHVKTE